MTREERQKQANEIRQVIENDVEDLAAHFEGGMHAKPPWAPFSEMHP